MKNNLYRAFISAALTVFAIVALVFCGCDTGSGDDLYHIYTKADFMAIAGGVGTWNKYYRLEADLVGVESITQPLGNSGYGRFIGHFDGNGHTINLNITGNHRSAGLFAGIGGGWLTIPSGSTSFVNAGTVVITP